MYAVHAACTEADVSTNRTAGSPLTLEIALEAVAGAVL